MVKKMRLSPNQLAETKSGFAGLKGIAGYKSSNAEYDVAVIQPVKTAIDTLTAQGAKLLVQLGEVRDRIAANGIQFTQKMKGAAQQVIAQFGDDSMEIQTLGRKRSSERAPNRPKSVKP